MKNTILVFVVLLTHKVSVAQSDTVYHYYSKAGNEVAIDSAFSYTKLYKSAENWFGKEFYKQGNSIKSEGTYLDKEAKKPHGNFRNYNTNGLLEMTADWDNGKLLARTYYYKNGAKKSWIKYADKGENDQMAWDESGKEIRNYVVEKEARFKGGMMGWQKFLEKNLHADVAAKTGASEGDYRVEVRFTVNESGIVTKVHAASVPAACEPCAAEAVNTIINSPPWEPAVQTMNR